MLNKRTIESLIKAGAFDSLGHPRQGLLRVYEQIIDQTVARRREEAEGQFDLFSAMADSADDGSPVGDHPVPIARPRVRQEGAPGLREGDARASTSATTR